MDIVSRILDFDFSATDTFAIALIASGMITCFFGYRLFKIVLAITGFVAGGALAWTVLTAAGYGTMVTIAGTLLAALVGGVAMFSLFFAGVFLFGCAMGLLMAIVIMSAIGSELNVVVVSIFALVNGLATLWFRKVLVVASTALTGAWSILSGVLAIPRLHPTLDGARSRSVPGPDGACHSIWLLSYLPGRQLGDVRQTAGLRHNLGCAIAHLARALRSFFHPAAGRELLWDLKHASKLRPHLVEIPDRARRQLAEEALDRFDARAATVLPSLRAQVIHSDANDWNVIVDPTDAERIAGIIDFGDIVHSALINDVGIALATTIVDLEAPIEAACEIVAGYHAVTPLQPDELGILFELWLGRLHPHRPGNAVCV